MFCSFLWSPKERPLFVELHWLPLVPLIKFNSFMMVPYKLLNGTAPIYLNAPAKAYVTNWSLWSSSNCQVVVPTTRSTQSRLFPCFLLHADGMIHCALPEQEASLSNFKKALEDPVVQRASPNLAFKFFLHFPPC